MTFVILQPCCNDASCADVCPVDCIHPTPDDPAYMQAEMLHIDPDSCIDCGACVDECPVDAIRADHELTDSQARYLEFNAAYFRTHPTERHTGKNSPSRNRLDVRGRIAIVGTGPAAFYAASELSSVRGITVEMYDRLLTPYGLVRAGVAPDHPQTKTIGDLFRAVAGRSSVRVHLGVDIGVDLTHDDLMRYHDAVVYAVGASADKSANIPGEDLPGSHAATEFVAWYNGHPDYAEKYFDLSVDRAVVIGNGNVALDLARILTASPDELARTDIADHALEALSRSRVKEVVVVGRRGPAEAKFTNPELAALVDSPDIDLVLSDPTSHLDTDSLFRLPPGEVEPNVATKVELLRGLPFAQGPSAGAAPKKRIVLRFRASPIGISGPDRVTGVTLAHNRLRRSEHGLVLAEPSERTDTIDAGLVLRSVGYRGRAVPGLPFDDERGVIANVGGRVLGEDGSVLAGVYVAGWIKRGPTGVIGTNKRCAEETVANLLQDLAADRVDRPARGAEDLAAFLLEKVPDALSFSDWTRIDRAETSMGTTVDRPRVKLVTTSAIRAALGGLRHS